MIKVNRWPEKFKRDRWPKSYKYYKEYDRLTKYDLISELKKL